MVFSWFRSPRSFLALWENDVTVGWRAFVRQRTPAVSPAPPARDTGQPPPDNRPNACEHPAIAVGGGLPQSLLLADGRGRSSTPYWCPPLMSKETPWPPNQTPTFNHPGTRRTRSMISSTWWKTMSTRPPERAPRPSCQGRIWMLTVDRSRTLPRINVLPVRPDSGRFGAWQSRCRLTNRT